MPCTFAQTTPLLCHSILGVATAGDVQYDVQYAAYGEVMGAYGGVGGAYGEEDMMVEGMAFVLS